jgi:hypothetical protein
MNKNLKLTRSGYIPIIVSMDTKIWIYLFILYIIVIVVVVVIAFIGFYETLAD